MLPHGTEAFTTAALEDRVNRQFLAEACFREAYGHLARSGALEAAERRGDTLEPLRAAIGGGERATHLTLARDYHAAALRHRRAFDDGKGRLERAKPGLLKGVFATAIAAEIISIPVLLMSCVAMTKPRRGAAAGPAPP